MFIIKIMANKKGNFKHGYYGTRTYKSWSEMKRRCGDKKNKIYSNIYFCKRWNKFENFLNDMGERPANTSIDRIDNNKGYSKENCRWATRKTQANNRSNRRVFNYKNKSLTVTEWAEVTGIKRSTIAQKIYCYNWPLKMALEKGGGLFG